MEPHLYYIKLTNKKENLIGYKIGVTTRPLNRRFASYYGNSLIELEILYHENRSNGEVIEQAILERYSNFLLGEQAKKLLNKEHSAGFSEIFTTDLRTLDANFLHGEYKEYKTPVQKSIQALNYYTVKAELGENINMREAAKKFAVSVSAVSKILSLKKVAGELVVQTLFNGDSIPITALKKDGTIFTKHSTSPDAIRKHYQEMLDGTNSEYKDTIEAQEMAYAQLEITRLLSIMSHDGIKYLISGLERLKDTNKTSYNKEIVEKELGMTPTKEVI